MRTASDKIQLFKKFFIGLTHVYGTYDPVTERSWQVKKPVTDDTIFTHLKGLQPYGVYLLTGERTQAIAADFDELDPFPPIEFMNAAKHYRLPAYIETSKSKGFHVWIFFNENGVKAFKARLVIKHILEEIEHSKIEIFPKQSHLGAGSSFGNFINAPMFGGLVPLGKTVFIAPPTLKPYPNQWSFLETIERVDEQVLDEIIEINDLSLHQTQLQPLHRDSDNGNTSRFGLPFCAQKMLQNGVTQFQRVSCFRLAVHLKRLGIPYDLTVSVLRTWANKNRPNKGKGVITEREINEQAKYAFSRNYQGYGCSSEAVVPFCNPDCPVNRVKK